MTRKLKCVIVTSTGGSVMNALLHNAFFKSQIFSVVSDRECPALEKAQRHGVPTEVFLEKQKQGFSDRLLAYLSANQIDYVISFYTKLFVGNLLHQYQDRILNLHPSLLPSFKGMDGFGDTVRYGARYLGTTIHFIDEHMDEGKIIMQTICPLDTNQEESALRHRLFQQQCKSLLQVMKWLAEGRIHVRNGRVIVEGCRFDNLEFSPNLDFEDALKLEL
ncbi:MAG TPA: formyltransferase family protein [Clostridia bacterium]|nr:formyltransferase family protein [Clostridia bacterium]